MCIQVRRSVHVTTPWDPRTNTLTIPAEHNAEHRMQSVRAILTELNVPQPPVGAVCWCGDPITGISPRIPNQRTTHTEVMARGA
jgi:hypothetical protein